MALEGKGLVSSVGPQRSSWAARLFGGKAGQRPTQFPIQFTDNASRVRGAGIAIRFIDNALRMRAPGIEGKASRVDLVMTAKSLPLDHAERMMTNPYGLGFLRMERVKLPSPKPADDDQLGSPIGPQHLVTEDIQGANPNDLKPRYGDDGAWAMKELTWLVRTTGILTSASWYLNALNPVQWFRALWARIAK